MPRKPNTKCSICSKPLYRRPADLNAKYLCCKGCRSKLYKTKKNYYNKGLKIGRGWNKGKRKVNGDNLSYGRPREQKTKDVKHPHHKWWGI